MANINAGVSEDLVSLGEYNDFPRGELTVERDIVLTVILGGLFEKSNLSQAE